jgi:hypothetical protein
MMMLLLLLGLFSVLVRLLVLGRWRDLRVG